MRDCRAKLPSPIFVACAFEISEVVDPTRASFEATNLRNAEGKTCQDVAVKYGSCATLRTLMTVHHIKITEEVVKAAAGNWKSVKDAMALLLEKRGSDIIVTEEMAKAAAWNNMRSGKEVMTLLLEKRGSDVEITERSRLMQE